MQRGPVQYVDFVDVLQCRIWETFWAIQELPGISVLRSSCLIGAKVTNIDAVCALSIGCLRK